VRVVPRSAAAIALLFRLFRRRTLVSLERIETFEDETAVVAEQLMQSKHPDKENRIVIIPLNPLALAPWTLHTVHNSRVRVSACAIMSSMKDSEEKVQPEQTLDPLIEAYKKDIDMTLIQETCASQWMNAFSS